MNVRNTFIIFIVSGFWHGANWTFVVWGALNAVYFLPILLADKNRHNLEIVAAGRNLPTIRELSSMLLTFSLTVFAWIFFRANNISHAISYISEIFSPSLFSWPNFAGMNGSFITLFLLVIFILMEWKGREEQYAIAKFGFNWKRPIRYAMYYAIIIALFWFGGKEQQFIYFQF